MATLEPFSELLCPRSWWKMIHYPSVQRTESGGNRRLLQFYGYNFMRPEGGLMNSSQRFQPGDIAPRSGIYRAHHYAHRVPHTLIIMAGTILPRCKRCGDRVRFAPMVAGEPIESDVDLAQSEFAA